MISLCVRCFCGPEAFHGCTEKPCAKGNDVSELRSQLCWLIRVLSMVFNSNVDSLTDIALELLTLITLFLSNLIQFCVSGVAWNLKIVMLDETGCRSLQLMVRPGIDRST